MTKSKKEIDMSKVSFTNEQLQAINEKGSNILVAAAARKWKNSSFSRTYYSYDIRRKCKY